MKTANSILVSYVTVVLLGCGGDDNTPAGPADGTAPQDSTTLDTSPIDAGVADTQKDVLDASTAPSHPANWSIMVGHGVRACGYEVEVDAPSMIGATPIKKGLSYVSLFADGGVQSVTQLKTTGHLADCDLAEGPDTIDQFVNGNSSTSYQVTGAAMRGRLDTNTRARSPRDNRVRLLLLGRLRSSIGLSVNSTAIGFGPATLTLDSRRPIQ